MPGAPDTPAVDIGEAIQRGVEVLAQQSVQTLTFKMTAVADLYRGGVRATKPRAPAAWELCSPRWPNDIALVV